MEPTGRAPALTLALRAVPLPEGEGASRTCVTLSLHDKRARDVDSALPLSRAVRGRISQSAVSCFARAMDLHQVTRSDVLRPRCGRQRRRGSCPCRTDPARMAE